MTEGHNIFILFKKKEDICAVRMKGCNLQTKGGSYFIFCKLFYILLNLSLFVCQRALYSIEYECVLIIYHI